MTDIDGIKLLEEVREWFATYICTVSDGDIDLLALWAVHTHLVAECYTTPRLQIDSPVPGSGKTTVLEHLLRLCHEPVQMASVTSPALLARLVADHPRTLLIDEADRTLSPEKDGIDDMMAVLNSGYKRGGTRPVLVPTKGGTWAPDEMSTFAAVAIAGNQPKLPDDTKSRCIRVLLFPDVENTTEESDWELLDPVAGELRDRIASWAAQVSLTVRSTRPVMPEGITGRFREKWAPLRRIADAAGGDWPAVVDLMAIADKKEWEMDKEDGAVREPPAMLLLKHMHAVWPEEEEFLATSILINRLITDYPATWGPDGPFNKPLTVQRLGRMLAGSYKIHSDRIGHGGPRGYNRRLLDRAWRRFRIGPLPLSSDR